MKDYVRLLAVATIVAVYGFLVAQARGESPEAIKQGIWENMQANFHACNEENLPKLLATVSRELPQRELFVETIKAEWAAEDTYTRLVDVEVLPHSDAPNANCTFPYATAWITQQTIRPNSQNIQAFEQCRNGRCRDKDLAHLFAISPNHDTVRYQALFKKEGGKWKGIANLTEPEPVGAQAEAEETASVGAFN
jgi:hypothetical protein